MVIQGSPGRVQKFQEAYKHGKLEMEDDNRTYTLGYRYKDCLYVKIVEDKDKRPELEENHWEVNVLREMGRVERFLFKLKLFKTIFD